MAEAETNIFTESKPENTNADGNPQEGISLETLGDPQNILIPPEDELTVAGFLKKAKYQKILLMNQSNWQKFNH